MSHHTNERVEIVLGSRNPGKAREISELLDPIGIDIRSLNEFPDVPDVIEDGVSFGENAAKKASETAIVLSRWVIAEDSGLAVDALGGAPGIFSARFSGENATDERNNQKLLAELADVPTEKRGAKYVCHVAVSDPSGQVQLSVERECRGRITTEARGTNGFGYDPYFLIPEYHQTFGELSPLVKKVLSHRARAMRNLMGSLRKIRDRI
jgi:XTP/dITP diphosphohydrolase